MRTDAVRFPGASVSGLDPWERGIAPAESPLSGPVRVIEITPEILAEEERKERERLAAVTVGWSIRSSLSEENLRRKMPARKATKSAVSKRPAAHTAAARTATAVAVALQIPVDETAASIIVLPLEVTTPELDEAPEAEPEVVQADEAETLAEVNPVAKLEDAEPDLGQPAEEEDEPAQPSRRECVNGCGRSVTKRNLTCVCTHCQKGTEPKARTPKQAYFCTRLIAADEDEFNVDQLWKNLSAEDKWAVLEIAMGVKRCSALPPTTCGNTSLT